MALPLSPKMVLQKLACYANNEGGYWPGQVKLAVQYNLSARSVIN
ncbi:helix-turn-helix domain-containing protein [Chitinimonas sp. BJB300]|nr:helix-turn-helix domain-containing protein [Chitinimonas sp. BJB300]